jgi:hypothetical protein
LRIEEGKIMANRVATCPRAKQIVGQKNWQGWAGHFAFPGFVAMWNYAYTYPDPGSPYIVGGSGAWNFGSCAGGALTGSAANFAAGDLVLREFPTIGPLTDYFTGIAQSYPNFYHVYICTAAITGSTTDPATDSTHFQPWDFLTFKFVGSTWTHPNGEPAGGPSNWPLEMAARAVFAVATDTAQFDLTITTELDNFPLYPATFSGLSAKLGTTNDTANSLADETVQEASASGTFTYDWTFPNRYDGTTATYTPPGTLPSTEQAHYIFPAVPLQKPIGFIPNYPGDGSVDSVLKIDASPPAIYRYSLVSWSFSSTTISFEFAAWSYADDVEFNIFLEHFGPLASAPGTITQTLTLGGTSYTLTEVAADATSLMGATTFDSLAWGTSWTNRWDHTGALVSTQNFAFTVANAITCSCAVGTEVKWGAAVNGLFLSGVTYCYASKALVDVCGNYCQRTYNCPTVTCVSGNVDGFAPVEIEPPGTPGESVGIYAGCQCI